MKKFLPFLFLLFFYSNSFGQITMESNVSASVLSDSLVLARAAFKDSVGNTTTKIRNSKNSDSLGSRTLAQVRTEIGDTTRKIASALGTNDSTAARQYVSDSLQVARASAGDSARKIASAIGANDSTYIRKVVSDSGIPKTDSSEVRAILKDSAVADLPTYQTVELVSFFVDTNRTLGMGGTDAKSDTIYNWIDFRSDTMLLAIGTTDSAYARQQRCAMLGGINIGYGVAKVDTINVWFRTKQASADTQKVNFYVGEYNRITKSISWTDSSVNNADVDWTNITLKPTGIIKGDRLVMLIKVWCIGRNWVYIGEPYLVQY